MTARILVVDDESHLAEVISDNLRLEGYDVLTAGDGEQALAVWRREPLDLILLDIMMPKLSGLDVCETIRKEGGRVPILFLTARDTSEDVVQGLELGGDDYMTKPFHLRELLLRVRNILRRQEWSRSSKGPTELVFGPNRVDFSTYEAIGRQHRSVRLNQKECQIMRLLAEREGKVVSRQEIIERVWGEDAFPSTRTVDNFIVRLRQWFEPSGTEPRYIRTVRGVGYQFFREGDPAVREAGGSSPGPEAEYPNKDKGKP